MHVPFRKYNEVRLKPILPRVRPNVRTWFALYYAVSSSMNQILERTAI